MTTEAITLQQAADFHDESEVLAKLLEALPADQWNKTTQFKGWTINDVITHLHFWNKAADLSLRSPQEFRAYMASLMREIPTRGMRAIENAEIAERGPDLFHAWQTLYRDMAPRWQTLDPKARLQWAGPEMSARSMMTARQMETWAHGQEVFDLLGAQQPQSDRIRNIVVLGVNTFGWSHKVHGQDVPDQVPAISLTAPSGAIWQFGDDGQDNAITGDAIEFAQVVTQTRNIADTSLTVTGEIAIGWMQIAQCFAGPPETPPAKGTRFTAP